MEREVSYGEKCRVFMREGSNINSCSSCTTEGRQAMMKVGLYLD